MINIENLTEREKSIVNGYRKHWVIYQQSNYIKDFPIGHRIELEAIVKKEYKNFRTCVTCKSGVIELLKAAYG